MDLELAPVPEGEVHVIAERCKECGYCIEYCPTRVLVYTADTNARGYRYPTLRGEGGASCVDCKFCELICPELAIYVSAVTGPGQ